MKKFIVICAPVTSRSGYGAHSRDLVQAFIESDKYNVNVLDVPWGGCPRNALVDDTPINKKISSCIVNPGKPLNQQPDIYIDIRIPNEFQTPGKFNIGITAGVETNAVSQVWLESCNKMDLVIVPSEHSKAGFVNSLYEKVNNLPDGSQQKAGSLKLEKPMEVLFEGADNNIYKPLTKDEIDSKFFNWLNDEVPEKFAFLSVGQWTQGGFGEDRKNTGNLVKSFYEAFANKKKQPALILKTSGASYSILDIEDCKNKLNDIKSRFPKDWKLPNIYLLHGDFTDVEMNYLYNHPKVKSFVSLTHGEGFGRPLLEASTVGLPIIAPGWSGHLDFLDKNLSLLLPGEVKHVPESMVWENIIIKESQWFNVDTNSVYKALNLVFNDYNLYKKHANELMERNRKNFTLSKMSDKLDKLMEKYTKDLPTEVGLKLPKLRKI
tara:strand:+ start:1890 stop:3194 length:1305 start_codon:yes stop_codon:yes gene_type:complete